MDEIAHEREMRELWQETHERFHTLDKEALILARKEIDRRLKEMNQFREQIERERGEFLRREMFEEKHDALERDMDSRLKLLEATKNNLEGRMWAIGAVIMLLATGLNLLLRYVK